MIYNQTNTHSLSCCTALSQAYCLHPQPLLARTGSNTAPIEKYNTKASSGLILKLSATCAWWVPAPSRNGVPHMQRRDHRQNLLTDPRIWQSCAPGIRQQFWPTSFLAEDRAWGTPPSSCEYSGWRITYGHYSPNLGNNGLSLYQEMEPLEKMSYCRFKSQV